MTEARYQELIEAEREATSTRIREAMKDVAAGRVTRYERAEELIRELELDE